MAVPCAVVALTGSRIGLVVEGEDVNVVGEHKLDVIGLGIRHRTAMRSESGIGGARDRAPPAASTARRSERNFNPAINMPRNLGRRRNDPVAEFQEKKRREHGVEQRRANQTAEE